MGSSIYLLYLISQSLNLILRVVVKQPILACKAKFRSSKYDDFLLTDPTANSNNLNQIKSCLVYCFYICGVIFAFIVIATILMFGVELCVPNLNIAGQLNLMNLMETIFQQPIKNDDHQKIIINYQDKKIEEVQLSFIFQLFYILSFVILLQQVCTEIKKDEQEQ